jgi:hypothetical protein
MHEGKIKVKRGKRKEERGTEVPQSEEKPEKRKDGFSLQKQHLTELLASASGIKLFVLC